MKSTESWMHKGWVDLVLLFLGVILVILIACKDAPSWQWFFTVYLATVAFFMGYRRFRIADNQLATSNKQLATSNEQLKIATRKEDLDRHLAGMDLLAKNDFASRLLGTHILKALLDTELRESARISLKNVLKVDWRTGGTDGN